MRLIRCAVTGLLMGLANLVPGVSGGTMVLVMGLYDEFVSSIADLTRLRITKRNVVFIGVLGGVTVITIASLAGPTRSLVDAETTAMYALFIGMTLGGAPMLWRMLQPVRAGTIVATMVGIALMCAVAASRGDSGRPDHGTEMRSGTPTAGEQVSIGHSYGRDVLAGVLGMSAMVLPGISGAYMLLIVGRYQAILGAISLTMDYATSGGQAGDLAGLHVLVPVAIGSILSIVVVSNLLKWLLRHHQKPTVGLLLGILLGSVVGLWPFDAATTADGYIKAGVLFPAGLVLTTLLSRIGRGRPPEPEA